MSNEIMNESEHELFRLKQENEELKAKIETYNCSPNCYKYKEAEKYKQALEEIRKDIEIDIECKTYEIENDCFNETRCKALGEHNEFLKELKNKIDEVQK